MEDLTPGSNRRVNRPVTQSTTPQTVDDLRDPRDVYENWDAIIEAVRTEFSTLGSQLEGGYKAMSDSTNFYQAVSSAVNHHNLGIPPNGLDRLAKLLYEHFFGLGVMSTYLQLPNLEEISLNRWDEMYLTVAGKTQAVDSPFRSEREVKQFLDAVFAQNNRAINDTNPAQDGFLKDGSRIHADLPPLSVRGACFSIRKFRPMAFTMDDYVKMGTLTDEFHEHLLDWISKGMNIVVSGGTSSGKTTFLNAVGKLLPPDDRLIIIEDTKELQIEMPNMIYLQKVGGDSRDTRDKATGINIRDALRYSLRLRPDRIIVGEVRSHEAFDLLQALNTGHDGSLTTIHANSAVDAISRLESLAIGAGELPLDAIQDQIARAIDIVIQVSRFRGISARKVVEAWQFFHLYQLTEEGRQLAGELYKQNIVQKVRGPIYALPLFTRDKEGNLVHQNELLPVVGKDIVWDHASQ